MGHGTLLSSYDGNGLFFSFAGESIYELTFGDGPLGLTLVNDARKTKVLVQAVKGSALSQGVAVGDELRLLNGRPLGGDYDAAVDSIAAAARPLQLTFARPKSATISVTTYRLKRNLEVTNAMF